MTPSTYQMSSGKRIETVNIQEVGDIVLPGKRTLATITIDCMFPAQSYPFAQTALNPAEYIAEFQRWAVSQRAVRLIISGTSINLQVLVESISYGERDGTNDVYATITLREYEPVEAVETAQVASVNKPRPPGAGPIKGEGQSVKVGPNDTVQSVARKYYPAQGMAEAGKAQTDAIKRIMLDNHIKNSALLQAGTVLSLPNTNRFGGGGR